MVDVSDRFKELAQENGRHVWCKIYAGTEVFLDDRIVDMSFDDVVHPDWVTVGTACANRLHFTAHFSGELAAGDTVRPFISFDGEEWCPLGVFFISRRYVREGYISVTAYDKMYSLDIPYRYTGTLPVDSVTLLLDICRSFGLEAGKTGHAHELASLPDDCTARDMIGYIAGLDRSCAKFDRYGRLTLNRHEMADHYLLDKCCTQIQRNLSYSTITSLKADTGTQVLTAGSGADISCIEMYNPLMTQELLEDLFDHMKGISYYGAELEMQGLPFLEAGDRVYFLDGKLLYQLFISEIEYYYDGSLTAVLHSKNKTDDTPARDDLEDILAELKKALSTMYYTQENDAQIVIGETPAVITDIEFEAEEGSAARLDAAFTVKNFTGDMLLMKIYVNGNEALRQPVQTLTGSNYELLHLYHLAQKLLEGKNRIHVTAQTLNGSAYILPHQLFASVSGHGISGTSSPDNKLSLTDTADTIRLNALLMEPAKLYDSVST